MQTQFATEKPEVAYRDPADDQLFETFTNALPSFMLLAFRAARAFALFGVTLLIMRGAPAIASGWSLATCIAVLSLFNMTKWVSAAAIGVLLILAVVPPQTLALLFSR